MAVVSYKGEDLDIPVPHNFSGEYAALLKGWLEGIMYGKEEHPWGVVVEEKEEL